MITIPVEPKLTEYLHSKAAWAGIPLNGTFELTPCCNMACKMCYVRMTKQQQEEIAPLRTAKEWLSLAEEAKKAEEAFNKKKASLDQAAQEKMVMEYRQQLAEKEQTLIKGVMEKIDSAVAEVAKAKGVSVVLDKNNVFYGGTDLTADVLAKIKK